MKKKNKKDTKSPAKKAKRKMPSGEAHPSAKLTDDKVAAIRKKYESGKYTQAELGEKYGITTQYANRIICGAVR